MFDSVVDIVFDSEFESVFNRMTNIPMRPLDVDTAGASNVNAIASVDTSEVTVNPKSCAQYFSSYLRMCVHVYAYVCPPPPPQSKVIWGGATHASCGRASIGVWCVCARVCAIARLAALRDGHVQRLIKDWIAPY